MWQHDSSWPASVTRSPPGTQADLTFKVMPEKEEKQSQEDEPTTNRGWDVTLTVPLRAYFNREVQIYPDTSVI